METISCTVSAVLAVPFFEISAQIFFAVKKWACWTGEGPTLAEKKESIREAVDNHFDEMSEGLLMVIAGYAQAAYGNGHNSLGGKNILACFWIT